MKETRQNTQIPESQQLLKAATSNTSREETRSDWFNQAVKQMQNRVVSNKQEEKALETGSRTDK